ncbi:PRELI-like family-domain-containing protein [Halteromyces radiatus]|uniref:PRELI-like family-domain-containing protein n=1 Tax=Halteromyces radiatus TaxID=101107 RepID=UPI002220FE8D|nr:PRELI-like family-domain-containing protein [Halteromyces radiatus]KAI8086574.1 PRELI-like family-domain-containing protein [Halteromyces radiatus]
MKLFQTVHDFNYEWNLVSTAQWQKYPNDNCPHVQAVDVLNSSIDHTTGILTTERLITVVQNVPSLIRKILGTGTTQYVREISIIDPKAKTLTMRSINLTMANLLKVEETIVYREHPDDQQKTQFTQQAAISAGSMMSRWASIIEDFSLKRFQQNAAVGREGFSKVLERFVVMAEAADSNKAGLGQ